MTSRVLGHVVLFPLHSHPPGPVRPVLRAFVGLLLAWSAAVRTAEDSDTAAPAAGCSAGAGAPPAVDVHLALTGAQVRASLALPLSPLPVVGCAVPIPFQVPEAYRPQFALWRDVEGQAMCADGTPVPVPLRLRVQPDGALQYAV